MTDRKLHDAVEIISRTGTKIGNVAVTFTVGRIKPTLKPKPASASLCEDCPPVGYPTDKTRCTPCPRRGLGETSPLSKEGK